MKNISLKIIVFVILLNGCTDSAEKKFTNPILAGFYADPSICKVGEDYYLVNSTFSFFPGIPVFHSKDLVNWELIGHVLDRADQFDVQGLTMSRGIFAPAISHSDGLFYVVCTIVDGGGNFVSSAKDPAGPWSDPVWLPEVNGIDPSLYFDSPDDSYIIFNSEAPDNNPQYEGHRSIRMFKFDKNNLKVVGDERLLINGGTDISKKPVWIEGPHIYKRFEYYYLMAAEGGTAEDHSEVIFRSKSIYGPYESYSENPILTQKHLDPKRDFPITSTGHADLVSTDSGEWWAVFLGCRPYRPFEKNFYNIGRETFLAPVKWIEDENLKGTYWPVINPDFDEVQYYYDYPNTASSEWEVETPYSGNFTTSYNFENDDLHKNFIFLRASGEDWYSLKKKEGYLSISVRPETCSETSNPSLIAHRQQHLNCSASTSLNFDPKSENEKAGLIIFLNENHYYYICKSIENKIPVVQLYKSLAQNNSGNIMELVASRNLSKAESENEIKFKIEAEGKYYSFYYAFEDDSWISFKENLDGTFLRAIIPRDFIGTVYGMYATSLGNPTENIANFNWFVYSGNDEVYK